jgi:uncharacterized protein YlxW (UPF0749 family)
MLFVTSATNAGGTDLRAGRYLDLPGLVQARSARVESLREQAQQVQAQIEARSQEVRSAPLRRINRAIARLRPAVGLTALEGPGLVVTLTDAPRDQTLGDDLDANLLVVHQQDIQAVVNALWAGGADAMTLQGQRIIATTGIKCVGNTVVLHGVPYSPPYRIAALGDPAALRQSLDRSAAVRSYLEYAAPPYNLGWSLRVRASITAPAYDGTLHLDHASTATRQPSRPNPAGP